MAEGEAKVDLAGEWLLRLDMIEQLAAGDAVRIFDASDHGSWAPVDY